MVLFREVTWTELAETALKYCTAAETHWKRKQGSRGSSVTTEMRRKNVSAVAIDTAYCFNSQCEKESDGLRQIGYTCTQHCAALTAAAAGAARENDMAALEVATVSMTAALWMALQPSSHGINVKLSGWFPPNHVVPDVGNETFVVAKRWNAHELSIGRHVLSDIIFVKF